MRTKWTGSYAILEMYPMDGYILKHEHRHCLKSAFPLKQVRYYYRGTEVSDSDEEPNESFISAEVEVIVISNTCEAPDKSVASTLRGVKYIAFKRPLIS